MKSLSEFNSKIKVLFTDIDDTMTDEGQLPANSYAALWKLHEAGVHVVPVTGRPAGWCEMIARFWPVRGIVGENGGFYFCYKNKQMLRRFVFDEQTQKQNREKLKLIEAEVLKKVPGSAVASDQFCRLMDLAIDFCEDVNPLPPSDVQKIVDVFNQHGAVAKVSSIHVNGWFGKYDKLSMALEFAKDEFGWSPEQAKQFCAFSGDSPNDEPMFAYFPHSFAVSNINKFLAQIQHKPAFVAPSHGAQGFVEIAEQLIKNL